MKFRQVIQKYLPAGHTLPDVPAAKPSITLPAIHFTESANLLSILPKPVHAEMPLTFEALHQPYGFVLYRTKQTGGASGTLSIKELRDYGIVFINGKKIGVLDRRLKQDSIAVDLPAGEVTIDILVENLGRINFGPNLLKNNKGITTSVSLNGKALKGWDMYSLPFQNIHAIKFDKNNSSQDMPVVKKAYFTITETADTYLDMRNWGKGSVWINGHNLGRYWSIGPQQTLYVPVEWLKKGRNEVVILELLKPEQNEVSGLSKPILDEVKK
jgi:beta-galactosidase